MEYLTYKTLHIISIATLIISLGFVIAGTWIEGKNQIRKIGFITHGISWVLVFFTAHKLVGVLNMGENFPNWAIAKTACWLLLGVGVYFAKKKPQWAVVHYSMVVFLCSVAIGLAVFKPDLSF
ncbi:hypothetical protein [Bdellovibrio sp. GT3]|uniref:hypothetical protein n=1 Tax=Bdellovibrio sp. GT3 TaxID=3136282 RepID=UPI0030F0C8F9